MRWQDPLPEPEKMPPTGVTKAYFDSRSSLIVPAPTFWVSLELTH
jgi:hypothetical protein